ncbi:hypothetical protein [Sulfitobacter sp.]|uniref:hypothetical protein n=1 Tax=Sulfitobacter sp. TaxID=1903071 RepID=UPI003001B30D
MTFRPAYDVALEYGGHTVCLRASLRAATYLEALHNGFPALVTKVTQGHTGTLRQIILNSATDQSAAQHLLGAMKGAKLIDVQKVLITPAFAILTALMTPDLATGQAEAAKAPTGKPVKWATLYADLYKIATGWLGWTPDTAWSATLPEILNAFDGHVEQLKAVHGTADDDATEAPGMSADQRQANIDAGLDPEFDRAALHALKAKL